MAVFASTPLDGIVVAEVVRGIPRCVPTGHVENFDERREFPMSAIMSVITMTGSVSEPDGGCHHPVPCPARSMAMNSNEVQVSTKTWRVARRVSRLVIARPPVPMAQCPSVG